jgi:hypothetical protein
MGQALEQHRAHRKGKSGVKNAPQRTRRSTPRRVEDFLMAVTLNQPGFPQIQIQLMVTVFVNEVIDQVELVPIEAINKGQARTVPVAETDDATRL